MLSQHYKEVLEGDKMQDQLDAMEIDAKSVDAMKVDNRVDNRS